jgi:apolipoprotein N-acyltransferase
VIQIADLTGVYGVSFLLVLSNVAVAQMVKVLINLRGSKAYLRQMWNPLWAGGALISLALIYGSVRLSMLSDQPASGSLKVGLIQGNINQAQKWDPAYQQETLEIYKELTRQALGSASTRNKGKPLDLIVWPETATPFFFEQEQVYREGLKAFTQDLQTPLLFGSPAMSLTQADTITRWDSDRFTLFNSAYLLSDDGMPVARYDKIHLVPFGEYVPLSSLLFFVHKLVEGIGDFGAGTEFTVMETTRARFGVVICFEVIFPELVRPFVREGAQLMATLTNDAWFGRSSAPYQHFSMVVFRSVENRVPFIRAANTGITGSIDATGRILGTTELFVKTYLVHEINLKKIKSFYTLYGDLFAYLCGIITLATLVGCFWRKRKR